MINSEFAIPAHHGNALNQWSTGPAFELIWNVSKLPPSHRRWVSLHGFPLSARRANCQWRSLLESHHSWGPQFFYFANITFIFSFCNTVLYMFRSSLTVSDRAWHRPSRALHCYRSVFSWPAISPCGLQLFWFQLPRPPAWQESLAMASRSHNFFCIAGCGLSHWQSVQLLCHPRSTWWRVKTTILGTCVTHSLAQWVD